MGIINITSKQLDALVVPSGSRLEEHITTTTATQPSRQIQARTERLEECRAEDRRRADGFEMFATKCSLWDDETLPFDPKSAFYLLDRWASGECGASSVISATYLRNRRLALTGSIRKLMDNNRDLEVAFVSMTNPAWRYGLDRVPWKLDDAIKCIVDHFDRESSMPGFFIVYLWVAFDAQRQRFTLSGRGICGGDKLQSFQDRQHRGKGAWVTTIKVHKTPSPTQQLLRMIPNEIPTKIDNGSDIDWAAQQNGMYLLQMSQRAFANQCIFDGVCLRGGQLIIVDSLKGRAVRISFHVE